MDSLRSSRPKSEAELKTRLEQALAEEGPFPKGAWNMRHAQAGGPSSSSASGAAASTEKEALKFKGDVLEKAEAKPKKGADSETQQLRRRLYVDSMECGQLVVSPKAKYDPKHLQLQTQCAHLYEELHWGANGTSVYASCGACGLKSVICYKRKSIMMMQSSKMSQKASDSHDQQQPQVQQPSEPERTSGSNLTFLVDLKPGMVMVDTGCRAACGGVGWHEALQEQMKNMNKVFLGRRAG